MIGQFEVAEALPFGHVVSTLGVGALSVLAVESPVWGLDCVNPKTRVLRSTWQCVGFVHDGWFLRVSVMFCDCDPELSMFWLFFSVIWY